MEQLELRVKHFEPHQALFGGEDGLDFYRHLLASGAKHLSPDGFMALEHGAAQQAAILALALQHDWGSFEAYQDLQGRDRYLLIYVPAQTA
jgi:release factor glutamine methyltransferase